MHCIIIIIVYSIADPNEVTGTKFFYLWYFHNYRGQKTQIREENVVFMLYNIYFRMEVRKKKRFIAVYRNLYFTTLQSVPPLQTKIKSYTGVYFHRLNSYDSLYLYQ